jgi:hypothetical protein
MHILKILDAYVTVILKWDVKGNNIVTNSQVIFHNGSLLHSMFNTQLLTTVHNSSRILTQVQLLPVLEHNSQITLRKLHVLSVCVSEHN